MTMMTTTGGGHLDRGPDKDNDEMMRMMMMTMINLTMMMMTMINLTMMMMI